MPSDGFDCFYIETPDGKGIAASDGLQSDPMRAANAALIVKAVNAYQPMLEALERAYDHVVKDAPNWFEDGSFEQRAMQAEAERLLAAIALAKGTPS